MGLNRLFGDVYRGRRVLVTGHTGFKGTWLTAWLLRLGAKVAGLSVGIPTTPSLFETLEHGKRIDHRIADIRDLESVREIVGEFRPDFIFHLAAQSIVSRSYKDPIETISTNVLGTANVLEVARGLKHACSVVIITSDKCYENVEWEWGYKETDHLGGRDVYSGSKGAAEVIFHAYQKSFFCDGATTRIRMATGRAGNVIGGGDWADDRIVADAVRSWSQDEVVQIRSPKATRPWQHVLEPLSGYLTLGQSLDQTPNLHGEQFNFGPRAEKSRTVAELLADLAQYWGMKEDDAFTVTDNIPFHEAGLLKLNCDKALFHLKWQATLRYEECAKLVSEWYYDFYRGTADMCSFTVGQIEEYECIAKERGVIWTRP